MEAILFDLDGTILDTEPLYEEAMTKAVNTMTTALGRGPLYDWETQKLIVGKGEHHGAQIIIEKLDLDITTTHLLQKRDGFLIELFKSVQLRNGMAEIVQLAEERGVPFAIATSSMRKYYKVKTAAHTPFFEKFNHSICGDEIQHAKPAPDIYLRSAELLGVDIRKCLVFEDSVAGAQSARAAGAGSIIVSPDARLDRQAFVGVCDKLVEKWADIELSDWLL